MFRRLKYLNRNNQIKNIKRNTSKNIYDIENKFTTIENDISNINNFYKLNNLLYLRSQGYCFILNETYNKTVTTGTTNYSDLLLFNDSTSHKIFIYDIDINLSDYTTTSTNLWINVLFTAHVDKNFTTTRNAINLKLDENNLSGDGSDSDYSGIYLHKNPQNISNNDGLLYRKLLYTSVGSEKEFHSVNLFQNEYIEVPENRGVIISLNSSSSLSLSYSITVKFFIIPNNFETENVVFN